MVVMTTERGRGGLNQRGHTMASGDGNVLYLGLASGHMSILFLLFKLQTFSMHTCM